VVLEGEDRDPGEDGQHGAPAEPPQRAGDELAHGLGPWGGLERGERRRLDEVEVVEEPDPRDAGQVVAPAREDDPALPADDVPYIRQKHRTPIPVRGRRRGT